jgi:hypothetical protein
MEAQTRPVVRNSVAHALGALAASGLAAVAGWAWQRTPTLPAVIWFALGMSGVALVIAGIALYCALERNAK